MEYKILLKPVARLNRPLQLLDICPTILQTQHKSGDNQPLVLVTPKLTSTQSKHIKNTLEDISIMETQQKLTLKNSQTSTYLSEDSLAKLSALLESELDLTTPEGRSFLISQGFVQKKDPDIWYSKMLKVYLVTTREKLSRQYLGFSPTWGILWNGRYLTAKTSEFPKTENGCSLSDILEDNPDEKYFLSDKMTKYLIARTEQNKDGHKPKLVTR